VRKVYDRTPMTANYPKAVATAQDLLTKYAISEPIVDVFQLAEREGVRIRFIPMPPDLQEVSGFLDFEGPTIYVNTEDSPARQMFTVAHELGHFLLHKGRNVKVLPRLLAPSDKNDTEREANCFAANMLVPESMLRKTMELYTLSPNDVSALAILFGVSKEFMSFRLQHV
jgi:Zn-dependent peptidase ImmA (M78 family)